MYDKREDQDTFVVEDIVIGQMIQLEYRVRFSGDTIHMIRRETFSGVEMEMEGALED